MPDSDAPADPTAPRFDPVTDPRVRRLLVAELVVVLAVTFGLSGAYAVLDLVSALLAPADLVQQLGDVPQVGEHPLAAHPA